jgi:hypothetical protein
MWITQKTLKNGHLLVVDNLKAQREELTRAKVGLKTNEAL